MRWVRNYENKSPLGANERIGRRPYCLMINEIAEVDQLASRYLLVEFRAFLFSSLNLETIIIKIVVSIAGHPGHSVTTVNVPDTVLVPDTPVRLIVNLQL